MERLQRRVLAEKMITLSKTDVTGFIHVLLF